MAVIKKKIKGYDYHARLIKVEGGEFDEMDAFVYIVGKQNKKAALKMFRGMYPYYNVVIYKVVENNNVYEMDIQTFIENATKVEE